MRHGKQQRALVLKARPEDGAGCGAGCLLAIVATWFVGWPLQDYLFYHYPVTRAQALVLSWPCVAACWLLYRPLLALTCPRRRAAIVIDDDGIVERTAWGQLRRTRWAEVTAVAHEDYRATLSTATGGTVVLTPEVDGWLTAVARAQAALGLAPGVSRGVHPADVEALLRVPPGGSLVGPYVPAGARRSPEAAVALLFVMLTPALDLRLVHAVAVLAIPCLLALGWLGVTGRVGRGRLTADGYGLRLERRRRSHWIDWRSVGHLQEEAVWVVLSTAQGDYGWRRFRGDETLIRAIEDVVEANQAEAALLRPAEDVPTGGLSRAADASVDLSRAVSRSDPPA